MEYLLELLQLCGDPSSGLVSHQGPLQDPSRLTQAMVKLVTNIITRLQSPQGCRGNLISVGFWGSGYVWRFLSSCQTPGSICPLGLLLNQQNMRALTIDTKSRLLQLTSSLSGAPRRKLIFHSEPTIGMQKAWQVKQYGQGGLAKGKIYTQWSSREEMRPQYPMQGWPVSILTFTA